MTTIATWFTRRWLGILAILLHFLAMAPTGTAAQDAETFATARRIIGLVQAGRHVDAMELLKSAFETAPPPQRQQVFQFAARICMTMSDVECARYFSNHPFMRTLPPAEAQPLTVNYGILLWLYTEILAGNHQSTARYMQAPGFPVALADPINNPVLFAELHLLAARQSRLAFDFEASRDHVDKALAATLSMTGEGFHASRLIVRIAYQLLENYDTERALRLVAAAVPLLQKIPPDSFLAYEFAQLTVDLLRYRKDFVGVAGGLHQVLSALDRLQLAPELKAYLTAATCNDLLAAEVLRGNHAAARSLLQSHPLTAAKPAILKRGHFANAHEFNFALAEEFVRLALDDHSETGWGDLLTMPPRWTTDPERLQEVQAFGQAAVGLRLARAGRKDEARQHFVEAGKARLAALMDRYRKSVYAAPLPHWADQLLLEFAVGATLSPGGTPDYELILGTSIVLGRSIQTSADDALTSQAVQESDDKKRIARSLRTIGYQRAAWENARLAALIKRLSSSDKRNPDAISKERLDVLFNASEFAEQQQRLRVSLGGKETDAGVVSVTELAALKRSLLPDEALVFYVPILDSVGKMCVRADQIVASTQKLDETAVADARILRAALTAAHPASVEADSQFPAAAAVRLRKLLFGGLEECLHASRRIYHVAPGGVLEHVPPAVLLAEVPPAMGSGFDLRVARWMIRDHSFVRTSSIGAFVAAKRLSKNRTATLDYLGVGDPVLAPNNAETPSGGAFAARGSVPVQSGALASLPELPETSDELQQVAQVFGAPKARVLRREAAGEEEFRLQPLSEFDVVHFATHGLVREELPGMQEPSLVLTPNPQGDAFNDGLLTSSQIAALPLRARLVILSACNSARYEPSIIDSGIQGLSTSFAIAGVPSMIAALWPIESSLTRDLITGVFRAARGSQDMAIADALAVAMRQHLDGPAPRPLLHPRFWAALVVLGDGSMKLNAPDRGPGRDLGGFVAVDPSKDGEILSVAPLDGDFISSTIGEWNGKRSPSLTRRQAIDGTTKWQVRDTDIGAGPAAATDRVIYIGGSAASSPGDSAVSVPILRSLMPDGRVSWSRRLPGGTGNTMVMALAVTSDHAALALVGPSLGERTGADYYLARVDAAGSEVGRMPLAISGEARSMLSGTLSVEKAAGLAIVNRGPLPKDRPDGLNGLGLPEFCVEGDAADVVFFDVAELRETKRVRIDRFNARSALATGDDWLVIGNLRDGCHRETRAAAYILKDDGSVQALWRDASPFQTSAQAGRRVGDSFEIVGRGRRSVAIREERPTFTMPDFSSMRSGDEAYLSDEIFAVRLSKTGLEERRDFVGAGFPIMPMGMASTNDRSVIFGTIGSRPLWMPR